MVAIRSLASSLAFLLKLQMKDPAKLNRFIESGGMAPHKMRFLKKGETYMSKKKKHKHRKTVSERLMDDAKIFYAKYTNDISCQSYQ